MHLQIRKDIFHLLQLYGRSMNSSHAQHASCVRDLSEVFFGPYSQRTKATAVPDPSVLQPKLNDWYTKYRKVPRVAMSA
jgi:hypothetical protein